MKVFLSAAAQSDNLGDVVIRRNVIRWTADSGSVPHVYVGTMPRSYVDALDLGSDAVTYENRRHWITDYLRSCAVERTHFVFAPGPQELVAGRAEIAHASTNILLAAAARVRSGRVLKVGRSLTGSSAPMRWLEAPLMRMTSLYVVRDRRSLDMVPGARFAPDVGVERGTRSSSRRQYVGLSFRGDREHPMGQIADLVEWSRELRLTPVVLTQVASDGARHEQLARYFGLEHLAWHSEGHPEQLRRLEEYYGSAKVMFSNRLHSLVLAWNGGAVPLGAARHGAEDKMTRHLEAMGLRENIVPEQAQLGDFLERIDAGLTSSSARAHEQCLAQLESLRTEVVRLLGRPEADPTRSSTG